MVLRGRVQLMKIKFIILFFGLCSTGYRFWIAKQLLLNNGIGRKPSRRVYIVALCSKTVCWRIFLMSETTPASTIMRADCGRARWSQCLLFQFFIYLSVCFKGVKTWRGRENRIIPTFISATLFVFRRLVWGYSKNDLITFYEWKS